MWAADFFVSCHSGEMRRGIAKIMRILDCEVDIYAATNDANWLNAVFDSRKSSSSCVRHYVWEDDYVEFRKGSKKLIISLGLRDEYFHVIGCEKTSDSESS